MKHGAVDVVPDSWNEGASSKFRLQKIQHSGSVLHVDLRVRLGLRRSLLQPFQVEGIVCPELLLVSPEMWMLLAQRRLLGILCHF